MGGRIGGGSVGDGARCLARSSSAFEAAWLEYSMAFLTIDLGGGVKKVEVRRYPLGYRNPNVLAGEMVWLIETKGTSEAPANAIVDSVCVGDRPGQARIVGIIAFSGSECYADMKAFREDARSHCVKKGGDKDWDGVGERYAWRIASVKMLQAPILAPRKTQTGMPSATSFEVVLERRGGDWGCTNLHPR